MTTKLRKGINPVYPVVTNRKRCHESKKVPGEKYCFAIIGRKIVTGQAML
jgi:hypothetical protein